MSEPTSSLFDHIGGHETLRPLLQHFYSDVRQHQVIGPIFNKQIEDWTSHLEKILRFWTTVTGGPPTYAGPMMIAHIKLHLGPEHFEIWLDLWRRHCRIRLDAEKAEALINIAETMAERLQGGAHMFAQN